MTSVGYARVSSIGQELDVQIDKLASVYSRKNSQQLTPIVLS